MLMWMDVVSEPDSIDYVKQIRGAATENAEVVVISTRAEEISEVNDEDKKIS